MRKTLRYGTTTTLLITMVASLACSQPAYAETENDGSPSPTEMLAGLDESDAGEGLIEHMKNMERLQQDFNNAVSIAAITAEGTALVVAGIEFIRQTSKSTDARRKTGEEEGGERKEDAKSTGETVTED